MDKCILYDRDCIDCLECEKCDFDDSKICDSCGKCLTQSDYGVINIEKIILTNTEEENL